MQDAAGNVYVPGGTGNRITPAGSTFNFRFSHAADTNQRWRVHLKLVSSHSRLEASSENRIVRLSAGGDPQPLTNSAGEVFQASFDGRALLIDGIEGSNAPAHGWTVLAATNTDSGERLRMPPYALGRPLPGKSGESAVRTWPVAPGPHNHVVVHLAYPETTNTVFQLIPPAEAKP
jgi:hypothetical protein